jgi:hypothetical protein
VRAGSAWRAQRLKGSPPEAAYASERIAGARRVLAQRKAGQSLEESIAAPRKVTSAG